MSVNSDTESTAAHTGHVTLDPDAKHDPHATRFGDFLKASIKFEASDLIMKTGQKPKIRLRGALKPLDTTPVSFEEFVSITKHILNDEQMKDLHHYGSVDFAYDYDENTRFRVNLFQARGKLSVAARRISSHIRRFEELFLPPVMEEIAMQPQGIVLLCGVTGSGKTTTIAAMLDYVNERKPVHIVTIEDPIEYTHKSAKSVIVQREVHYDTYSFSAALRSALREDPDVVMIGEMRDLETMNIALQAAETGHLVFATVHTASAAETLDRVSNMFAPHERPMLWLRLSTTLRGVLSQKLLPKADGMGRVAAIEVMDVTPTIINLLEKGASDEIYGAIRQAGIEAYWGMQTMNQALLQFVKTGQITEADALANANPYTELRQMIRMAVTKGEIRPTPPGGGPPPMPAMPPPVPGAPAR